MFSDGCDYCKRRKAGQMPYLKEIGETFSKLNMVEVPMFAEEIKGMEALKKLKSVLFNREN
jgi:anion-transporting  ArsA/GET3 family ATPase